MSWSATIISNGDGEMRWIPSPGSNSTIRSSERTVTSLRQDGALSSAVLVKNSQDSALDISAGAHRIGVDRRHERGLPTVVDVASFALQVGAHRGQEVGTNEPRQLAGPADEGDLGDHGSYPTIDCGHAQHQAAAMARSPDADTVGVDVLAPCHIRDGVAKVAGLGDRVDVLARCTVARAEVSVVIGQNIQSQLGKSTRRSRRDTFP